MIWGFFSIFRHFVISILRHLGSESDKSRQQGDGEWTWQRALVDSSGGFQQRVQRQSLGMLVEAVEECMFFWRVGIGFAPQACFLSPDSQMHGRCHYILVCHSDICCVSVVLQSHDGSLVRREYGADDHGTQVSSVRFCGHVQGLELDGRHGCAVFACSSVTSLWTYFAS